MKKLFSFLMCVSLLSVGLYSCGSDDEEDNGGGNGKETYVDLNRLKDTNFKSYCLNNFDTNNDEKLSTTEVEKVTKIDISNKDVASLEGIEFFTNLTRLICNDNSNITFINLGQNSKLTYFEGLSLNKLETLNISNNTAIDTLIFSDTKLKSIDLSKNRALVYLKAERSQLQDLDLSKNEKLTWISCNSNNLGRLDVTNNLLLEYLTCSTNYITSIDLSKNSLLKSLGCSHNNIGDLLSIQYNKKLTTLVCVSNDRMKYLFVWKGFDSTKFDTFSIPSHTKIEEH